MKVLGVLFVQYDPLTLICEQSEPKFKYRQLLPPVVQALVQPSEPWQRKGRRFGDWSQPAQPMGSETWEDGEDA